MWMPPAIQSHADAIAEGTGRKPLIERIDDRRYRTIAENTRVRMTIDFKMTGSRRWVWAASTLHVDGKRRALAENAAEFYRLFHNPDSGGHIPVNPADEPPIEPYPLEDPPPAEVATLHDGLTRRFVARLEESPLPEGVPLPVVSMGRLPDGAPVVELRLTPDTYLRFRYGRSPRTGVLSIDAVRLVVEGFDRSREADGNFETALRMLFDLQRGPQAGQPHGPAAVRGEHAAARNMSVEVRRQSVIRV